MPANAPLKPVMAKPKPPPQGTVLKVPKTLPSLKLPTVPRAGHKAATAALGGTDRRKSEIRMVAAYSTPSPSPKSVKLPSITPMSKKASSVIVEFGRGRRITEEEPTAAELEAQAITAAAAAERQAAKERREKNRTRLMRFAPKGDSKSLDAAAGWFEFTPPVKKLPQRARGTDESNDREALSSLRMVAPLRVVDGPCGQPHQTDLTSPLYDVPTPRGQLVDGEMQPHDVVEAAQAAYTASSWFDHATLSYLLFAISHAQRIAPLRLISLRLLARISLGTHQGGRSAGSVLAQIQQASAQFMSEAEPLLLKYRKDTGLRAKLGVITLGEHAKRQVSQRGVLPLFAPEHQAAIKEADIGLAPLEDGLATMHILLAHYLAPRFAAFVSRVASQARGAAVTHEVRPVKRFLRIKTKVDADFADSEYGEPPKTRHITDALSAVLVSDSAEGQLALWGQLVESLGERVLAASNTFAQSDAACKEGSAGMQQIVISVSFAPTRDGTDGFVEGGSNVAGSGAEGSHDAAATEAEVEPFTFGDMLADGEGWARAVANAIAANVQIAGEQEEEHYTEAAQLLGSLPGLAEQPIRMVVEMQLLLSYYHEARAKSELPFLIARAPTLRALASDCASYKDAVTT